MTKYFHSGALAMRTRQLLGKLGLLSLVAVAGLSGCRRAEDVWPTNGKKRVLVSFPPLYCFAKSVAGNDADVRCLLTTQGPHDFSPSSNDVLIARKADLILINGLGLDEWVAKLLKKGQGKLVEVAETIPEGELKHSAEGKYEEGKHDGHEHSHGEHDPHVWLGPPQAKVMTLAIAAKLGEIDPANKKNYDDRALAYCQELDKLYEHGKAAFKDKKNRNIIATHDSLQYFAAAFGLKVVDSIQPRAGIEADAKKLTGLVKICKEQKVNVIAVEPQYSKTHAESLKKELANHGVSVELVEVDPLETAPAAANKADPDPAYYLQRMYRNIDNLAKALP
jgi:ABC-type Zn uptake system ZnuABC Zn-binding protein ZnuA